ncbi:MAG: hypothetical protein AAFY39_17455 [Pseudomonadota bacterium]
MNTHDLKLAAARAAIVLVPSYSVAWMSDKMVYVVPTLAAASFFAATISSTSEQTIRRTDEDPGLESTETDTDANNSELDSGLEFLE